MYSSVSIMIFNLVKTYIWDMKLTPFQITSHIYLTKKGRMFWTPINNVTQVYPFNYLHKMELNNTWNIKKNMNMYTYKNCMFAIFCLSQRRQSLNLNKLKIVATHSISPPYTCRPIPSRGKKLCSSIINKYKFQ
jgi:hypothetical protein